MSHRPTKAEQADAADRWVDAERAALAAISEMFQILRERQEKGRSGRVGPLFPFSADRVVLLLDVAQEKIWDAHGIIAAHGYDSHRAARIEAGEANP